MSFLFSRQVLLLRTTDYHYTDSNGDGQLHKSSNTLASGGAVANSISAVYSASTSQGVLAWNDENPDGSEPSYAAHAKGLLHFDERGGMYVIHSVPKFPDLNSGVYSYPHSGTVYGQSFMCLSVGASSVSQIISSLVVTHPGLYVTSASDALVSRFFSLLSVINGNFTKQPLATSFNISTLGGQPFVLFAKNREWDNFLYLDLVAPQLNSDLVVESWTNGGQTNTDFTFCKNDTVDHNIYNAMHIRFGSDTWARSKDHSKWAVGVHNSWVCIGGINRQKSQNLRGGGTCCSVMPAVHASMYGAIVDVNACDTSKIDPVGSQPPLLQDRKRKVKNSGLRKPFLVENGKKNDCRPSSDASWDYLLFVREWPGTMSPGALPNFVDTFTLHGLWPNRDDGSWPQCCNRSYPFNYDEIAPIIQSVERVWYDTMHDQQNASSFWGHEWDKHGTCWASPFAASERDYFQQCVSLHDSMKLTQWLANAGITPADPSQTTYMRDQFVGAIQQNLGHSPLIKCTNLNGNTVIENVAVCLDKSFQVIDCPDNQVATWAQSENCGGSFGFPVIPH